MAVIAGKKQRKTTNKVPRWSNIARIKTQLPRNYPGSTSTKKRTMPSWGPAWRCSIRLPFSFPTPWRNKTIRHRSFDKSRWMWPDSIELISWYVLSRLSTQNSGHPSMILWHLLFSLEPFAGCPDRLDALRVHLCQSSTVTTTFCGAFFCQSSRLEVIVTPILHPLEKQQR